MHNRTDPTNPYTSGPHLPALSYATHARLTYQSSSCAIGTHSECAQSSPATAPVGVPVLYEVCACSCHTPNEPSEPRQANQ